MKLLVKKTVIFVTYCIFLSVCCELVLFLGAAAFPPVHAVISGEVKEYPPLDDVRLGVRPNPAHPDHDMKGFRNKNIPVHIDVLALGDSQTYGNAVARFQAWPQRVAQMTGMSTYNMAFGGYSPAHGLLLLDEVIALRPKRVILSVYAGNDLYDCFDVVYRLHQLPEMRNKDDRVIAEVEALEAAESLRSEVVRYYNMRAPKQTKKTEEGSDARVSRNAESVQWVQKIQSAFVSFRSSVMGIAGRSNLVGFGRALVRMMCYYYDLSRYIWSHIRDDALRTKDYCQVYDGKKFQTVFTSVYRHCALNTDDLRIREGQRILYAVIADMRERLAKEGIALSVVCIPTKECAFWEVVEADKGSAFDPDYTRLVEKETVFWEKTQAFLADNNIPVINTLPVLRLCFRDGKQPFSATYDGHLNPLGQKVVAERVAFALGEMQS